MTWKPPVDTRPKGSPPPSPVPSGGSSGKGPPPPPQTPAPAHVQKVTVQVSLRAAITATLISFVGSMFAGLFWFLVLRMWFGR